MKSLKQRLAEGDLILGTFISEVRNPNITHLMARCGFDYFILDNEHGSFSPETVSDVIAASHGAGIDVIVRVPEIRRETILKPLDCGAAGLLIPQVNTADEAAEVVRHAKYPPLGSRGAALRRPHNRYARVDAAAYLAQANNETLIVVQAETVEAIANVDAIAAVEGVDCVFAGPFDLSISLGIPGQIDHPREVEAIDTMLRACQKHGKAGGVLMFDADEMAAWINKGMRFAAYSSDVTMLADAAASAVSALKRSLDPKAT